MAAGAYPFVKLRGPAAIIGLSSAVPRPPFIAAGYLGEEQIAALKAVLAHPEVAKRFPVILVHHPPLDSRHRLLQLRDGLTDAASLRDVLATVPPVSCCSAISTFASAAVSALSTSCARAARRWSTRANRSAPATIFMSSRAETWPDQAHVLDSASGSLRRTEIPMRTTCL